MFQMYATFTDWDLNTSNITHINNSVLLGFSISNSASNGWSTNTYSTGNYCSASSLSGKTTGGYGNVTLVNFGDCFNAWSPVPVCTY